MLFSVQEPINRIWIIKHLREQLGKTTMESKAYLEYMLAGNLLEVPAFYPTVEYLDHLNRMGITVAVDVNTTEELEGRTYWDQYARTQEQNALDRDLATRLSKAALETQDGDLALEALSIMVDLLARGAYTTIACG